MTIFLPDERVFTPQTAKKGEHFGGKRQTSRATLIFRIVPVDNRHGRTIQAGVNLFQLAIV